MIIYIIIIIYLIIIIIIIITGANVAWAMLYICSSIYRIKINQDVSPRGLLKINVCIHVQIHKLVTTNYCIVK